MTPRLAGSTAGARLTTLWAVLSLAVGCLGCGGAQGSAQARAHRGDGDGPSERLPPGAFDYDTPLVEPVDIDGDFAMEQRVTFRHPRGEDSFRAVLQKQGNRLILVGLAPHGGRAFVLTQRGRELEFESFMPRELPFAPKYMMYDVHRVWFLGSSERETLRDNGERLAVRRHDGRVVEKRFERVSGTPEGAIVVRFPTGVTPAVPARAKPPERVRLENGWYGYEAIIETLSWQRLEPASR
jgi:hypothetical protein